MTEPQLPLFQLQFGPEPGVEKNAAMDPTGTYRYLLQRIVPPSKRRILWVMLNPSTADAFKDDNTIRKIVGFSTRAEFGEIVVANLFALRSKEPKDLRRALEAGKDPIGNPECDVYMEDQATRAEMVVCAWGAHGSLLDRDLQVIALLERFHGKPLRILGLTSNGPLGTPSRKRRQPIHPLYQPNNTPFSVWDR